MTQQHMQPDQAAKLREHVAYVKGDLKAILSLIAKLEKPLASPNWEQEARLVVRQSERCRKSLSLMEQALGPPKPARAASARGGAVKDPKGA